MTYYLGLGTNLGNKSENLQRAIREIEERVGHVSALSRFHASEPWGFASDNAFLNACCRVETALEPLEVLHLTQQIEREMGRTEKSVGGVYHDRLIDIDLLLCIDNEGRHVNMGTPELTLPHPLMQEREFVMTPLREIAPEWVVSEQEGQVGQ